MGIGEDGQPIEVEEDYAEDTPEEGAEHTEEEFTAEMREEFEQLKEENRRLREHLADSDQRCVTAVQLLQQAQDVLESRGAGMETTSELKLRIQEKPLDLTMETASTMHSSREESCQPSPTAPLEPPLQRPTTQPALHVSPPNLGSAPQLGPDGLPLPSLLGGQRPTEKRIFYAGSTLGPNRMVSGPMPGQFGYQPMQLPQDHTMPQPLGTTLLASASTPAIRPMKMPLGQEPIAVPPMRQPPAEPIMPLR